MFFTLLFLAVLERHNDNVETGDRYTASFYTAVLTMLCDPKQNHLLYDHAICSFKGDTIAFTSARHLIIHSTAPFFAFG